MPPMPTPLRRRAKLGGEQYELQGIGEGFIAMQRSSHRQKFPGFALSCQKVSSSCKKNIQHGGEKSSSANFAVV